MNENTAVLPGIDHVYVVYHNHQAYDVWFAGVSARAQCRNNGGRVNGWTYRKYPVAAKHNLSEASNLDNYPKTIK